ncbi:MAG TPA: cyclic nucleotide-binding domain-containing protein, partial [Leptospiraceae bacterium]|nr:cyclic nucleotide-binding domain-containing protein [Leptospiraceae bacterium]
MAKETEWSKFKSLNRSVAAREVLVQQGYPPTAMYILMDGVVDIFRNDKLISTIRNRGEYIGEISILL